MRHRTLALRSMATAPPILALLLGCGGGSTGGGPVVTYSNAGSNGNVQLLLTDAPSDAWANISVIIRGIWLVQQNQTEAAALALAPVYDGSASTTQTNLVQLDSVAQLLASASATAATYDRVIIKVDGNPANLTLTPALDASGNAQATIPTGQIVVNGTQDANGWVTVPTITLKSLLTVGAATTAVNLDFDLASPLFVVTHDLNPAAVYYSVNFQVAHKPQAALNDLVLHHNDGAVTLTSGTSFTLRTVNNANLAFAVDTTNKTLFYDLDAATFASNPSATLPADFTVSATAPVYARVSARVQADGTLVAVRVWYSTSAAKLPLFAPEGHVTRVDATNGFLWCLNDAGVPVKVATSSSTTFVLQGATTPIGTGTAFLSHLTRGFKVHLTANALTTPPTATEVDIQRAVYDGDITAANANTFTLTKLLQGTSDTPTVAYDPAFTWWNFAYPTATSTLITSFVGQATATAGTGSTPILARATTTLDWNSASTAWNALNLVFEPSSLSTAAQTVTTAYGNGQIGITYTPASGTASPLTVLLNPASGSQPIVTLYTRTATGVTVSTLTSDQWLSNLTYGTKVRVFGIPNGSGQLNAYLVNIFQ